MLAPLETLVIIQDRDLRIISLRKDLTQLPRLVEHAKSRLSGDQAAVAKAKEAVQANEVLIKRLELEVQTRRTTVQRLRDQQFQTRKNEEYQTLGHEVERYLADIRKVEDEELVLMETAENLRRTLAEAEAGLRRTQEVVDAELRQLQERRINDEARIVELEKERAPFTARVEPHLLATYDRLMTAKQNPVVVGLSHGQCKGCHMKVTTATVFKAKAEVELTHCENCGRILYFED